MFIKIFTIGLLCSFVFHGVAMNVAGREITFTYPEWKLKALVFSYDDGHVADRQLVEIFNRYNMRATFHIPSAWLKTKTQNRVSVNEINKLYAGHEVSGHGANHFNLAQLDKTQIDAEIKADINEWKRIIGKNIIGYAYPYGGYSAEVVKLLKANGLIYARTVDKKRNFDLPADFLKWHPQAHHTAKIYDLGEKYLNFEPQKMSVLLIWGHSYEFPSKNNWDVIEKFCALMAKKDDIFYATMGDVASYVTACRKIVSEFDGRKIKNNSGMRLFFIHNNRKIILDPQHEYILER